MSKTKAKILNKAQELLNERGVAQVSIRVLGDALGMSPGNLCYHYANIDAMVEALYFKLVQELDTLIRQSMERASTEGIDLHFVYDSIDQSFTIFQRYKFLMLDFADIMRRHTNLRKHFQALSQQRREQFRPMLLALQAGGWLKVEAYTGQYDDWIQQASVLGDFWMASAEIMLDGDDTFKRRYYVRLFFATLAPQLTPAGLAVFQQIVQV